MKKRLFQATSTALFLVLLIGFGIGQESTYLSQKLMLERDLHSRIENALSKILDDQRYVLNVTVDLIFTPTIKEEVTFRPGSERPAGLPPEAELPGEAELSSAKDDRTSLLTGWPIPGFEFGSYDEDEPAAEVPADKSTATTPSPTSGESKIVTQTYTDIQSSLPHIERMEVSCILPEGSAPELIENVRQIIMVASKFDRSRGDVLSIMTASFRERKDKKTAEAVILRTIAHKIDSLENAQKTLAAEPSGEEIAALSSELAMLKRQIEEKQQAEGAMVVEALLLQHEEDRRQREEEISALSSELAMFKRQIEEKQQALENVRQIIFDFGSNDEGETAVEEKTAEAVILQAIAHKIDSLENAAKTAQTNLAASQQVAEPSGEGAMMVEALLRQLEEERGQREGEIAALSSELAMLKRQIEEKQQAMEEAEQEAAVEAQQTKMEEYANQVNLLQERLVSLEDSLQMVAAQDQEGDEGTEEDAMRPQKLFAPIQEESSSSGVDNLPIYLMSAISLLAVIALAAVIIFNGRSKPKYVIPPWMMPPPKKKKVKKKKKSKKDDDNQSEASEPPVTAVQPPQLQTQPEPVVETEEDTAVMQSEIRSASQSVVSMSVGQPNTATTIVREWLEQEAPAPTEAAQPAEAAPAEPEPKAEEEQGKKKKKKKKK